MAEKGVVYLCMPAYGSACPDAVSAFWMAAYSSRLCRPLPVKPEGGSLLASCFNRFWIHALNLQTVFDQGRSARLEGQQAVSNPYKREDANYLFEGWLSGWMLKTEDRVNYFAMLHGDVVPCKDWLDILYRDLQESGADLMAAVVAIKDTKGITSTAIDDPADRFCVQTRLTMKQVDKLPKVFSAADCGYPGRKLLANTGCWICRLDKPWARVGDSRELALRFSIEDKIYHSKSGLLENATAPEDWNFSRDVQELGGTVMVTRNVPNRHIGQVGFMSTDTDGEWEVDEEALKEHGAPV